MGGRGKMRGGKEEGEGTLALQSEEGTSIGHMWTVDKSGKKSGNIFHVSSNFGGPNAVLQGHGRPVDGVREREASATQKAPIKVIMALIQVGGGAFWRIERQVRTLHVPNTCAPLSTLLLPTLRGARPAAELSVD